MEIKNLIFDWSGTLYDDVRASLTITQRTLKHFGGPHLNLKRYREDFDLPVWQFYKRHCRGVPVDEIDRYYFTHFGDYLKDNPRKARLFKNVPQLLKEAQGQGTRLFLYSTVKMELLEKMCVDLGIRKYFTAVGGSIKDKEKGLPGFVRRHGMSPSETIFVGDMEHDVRAAKKSGVWSGAMLCGYHSQERLLNLKPDFVWNEPEGVRKFLVSLKDVFPVGATHASPLHPIATVGALIFNAGDIFLIQTHKWSHTFGIPGGKIKQGEPMEKALKREIREETGMELKNIEFVMAHDSIRSKEFYKPNQHFLLLNFTATSKTRHFRLNDEAESGIWVKPKDALKLNLNEPTRVLIERYLK